VTDVGAADRVELVGVARTESIREGHFQLGGSIKDYGASNAKRVFLGDRGGCKKQFQI
jgi:hypothetical protein